MMAMKMKVVKILEMMTAMLMTISPVMTAVMEMTMRLMMTAAMETTARVTRTL